jgi:hypothetical protein
VLKRLAIAAITVAIGLGFTVVWLSTRLRADKLIVQAQTEARMLREQRDSILRVVARNDSLQAELMAVRAGFEEERGRLLAQVDSAEQRRATEQLTVRRLRRRADLQARLNQTFPEVAASDWGVREIWNEQEQIGIEYLLVPVGFTETFIIDHQNSLAYESQRDTLRSVVQLDSRIISLQDSVFSLERSSRSAFQTGYDQAFTLYQTLNERYIDELRKPRFSLGVKGGIATMAGTFALGVLIGSR